MDRPASSSSSARLWVAVFAPGLACVALGALVFDVVALWVVGLVLLMAPLLVQMFGADWSRETIPEGHHHHDPGHHDHDHGHHDRDGVQLERDSPA